MSVFDGSTDELTYGQALLELAARVSWPTELHGREAIRAIQVEHDLVPPDPDVVISVDPRDAEIAAQKAELDKLRAEKADRDRTARAAEQESEIAALRAALDTPPAPADGKGKGKA